MRYYNPACIKCSSLQAPCPDCIQNRVDSYKAVLSVDYKQKDKATLIEQGIKHDSTKAPMDLLPHEALEEVARVLAAGEAKYGTANWAKGIEMRRLLAAAMRHIGQFNSGEDVDSETDTLHIANAACNLLFAIWMMKNRPDLDNRWIKSVKTPGRTT